MTKKQQDSGRKDCVDGEEAAQLLGCHPRTVYRLVDKGELYGSHLKRNRLEIPRAEINAYLEQHPPRGKKVTPLESITQEVENLREQVKELLPLKSQVSRLEGLVSQLLAFLGDINTHTEENAEDQPQPRTLFPLHDVAQLLSQLRESRASAPTHLSILEKRGLPPDATTVKKFADTHQTSVYGIKKLYTDQKITLAIVPREAARNKLEWWVTPQQMPQLVQYWVDHAIPYTPCPECPHELQHDVAQAG